MGILNDQIVEPDNSVIITLNSSPEHEFPFGNVATLAVKDNDSWQWTTELTPYEDTLQWLQLQPTPEFDWWFDPGAADVGVNQNLAVISAPNVAMGVLKAQWTNPNIGPDDNLSIGPLRKTLEFNFNPLNGNIYLDSESSETTTGCDGILQG